jgi:hypothetical protein
MTDYYVDLDNPGAWNGRTGLNHTGNEWLGLSGLQYAADQVTAGNTINIKGTVVCTTLKNITYDNLSGTFTVGEEVRIDASNKGIVSEDTGTILTVEVTAGAFANNNTMTGQTSGATADVNVTVAVKNIGLDIDTNEGTVADGFIKFIGVNSSWVDDGTRCKLDGNAGAVAGCSYITQQSSNIICFENIEVDDADLNGFDNVGGYYPVFINCWAHDCDTYGFDSAYYGIYKQCLSSNNGDYGFASSTTAKYFGCIAHNNTTGFYGGTIAVGCIAVENSIRGIGNITNCLFCTIDENVDGIYFITGKNQLALFNRITNQSDDGLIVASGESCYDDWNLFYNNTGGDYDDASGAGLIEKGGNSKINSTGDGYTDQAGHDFNLTDSADYRREAITLPKWDGTSP